jgi:hypothetical protein
MSSKNNLHLVTQIKKEEKRGVLLLNIFGGEHFFLKIKN